MENRLSVSEFRKDTSEILNRVAYQGSRIVLQRRNKDVAVLVSLEDAAVLEELENRRDVEVLRRAKKEFEESGEPAIPLEEAAKRLGVKLRKK